MEHFENLKEGPPQLEMIGDFPSEPAKHPGSCRVSNETSNQEVQLESLLKCPKFMFFWDYSSDVRFCVSVCVFMVFEWRGVVRLKETYNL